MSQRRKKQPQAKAWEPLAPAALPPGAAEAFAEHGVEAPDEVWGNKTYTVFVRYGRVDGEVQPRSGLLWLSYHRRDRKAARDWRHAQAIKNEIAGAERVAVEVYPAESNLVDTSNEYHLWVLHEGVELPFGFDAGGLLMDAAEARADGSAARQRDWEPGIPTGRSLPRPGVFDLRRELGRAPTAQEYRDAR